MWHLLSEVAPPPQWTWLTQGGSVGILAAVVWAFMTGRIIPGSLYRQVCAERDRAIDKVYEGNAIAARMIEAAERKASS